MAGKAQSVAESRAHDSRPRAHMALGGFAIVRALSETILDFVPVAQLAYKSKTEAQSTIDDTPL